MNRNAIDSFFVIKILDCFMTSKQIKSEPPIQIKKRGVLYPLEKVFITEAIKLRRDATILGREKGDVIIGDYEVSSTHCQLQNVNDVYFIFDMNSTNGTFVNNERIVKAKLKPGDVITIGKTSFQFELEDEQNVRHITTIFKSKLKKNSVDSDKSNLIDTIIEGEFRNNQKLHVILTIKYHDQSHEQIELKQRIFFIGRASSFGRFEHDPEMSRRHLLVKVNDTGEVFVEDQGSTNGSFLNGSRIYGMHLIGPDDELKVGASRIKIQTKTD